jgi:hypothetical protein
MDLLRDRDHSPEEESQILVDAGIDAVLVVTPAESAWIPRRRVPTHIGHTVPGALDARMARTYIRPRVQFEASLRDRQSRDVVWTARMLSDGAGYGGWRALARSMAKKTAKQLLRDRVVQ